MWDVTLAGEQAGAEMKKVGRAGGSWDEESRRAGGSWDEESREGELSKRNIRGKFST